MKVSAQTIETHYEVIGSGKTVIMLHGWGCDWQIWSSVIPQLSDHYQLILVDLPGFGTSSNPPLDWNSYNYVEWLHEFVEHVAPKKELHIIGHSFGGKVASLFTAKYAAVSKVRKLILVDSAGTPPSLSAIKKLQQSILGLVPEKLKDQIPYSMKKKLLGVTRSATDHLNSTKVQRKILQNSIREYIIPELKSLTVPTLLIWGSLDEDTPLSHAEKFHNAITESKLIVYQNAGHFSFIDQPQQFITDIRGFIG